MEHASRTRLLSAAVLVAVFAAGAFVGFAAHTSLRAEAAEVTAGADEPRRPPIYSQVGPTSDQQLRIDSIIQEHRTRTNALDEQMRTALRKGFREILVETREAIKVVLTPEQAAQYQQLLDERDARVEAERREEEDQK
jgi:Spy/CpxP family protein refolding chaperone